jgi:hypothetical protein
MIDNSVTLETSEMDRLGQELRRLGSARVRVGILGGGVRPLDPSGERHPASGLRKRLGSITRYVAGKVSEAINNPTLGLIHEFGSKEVTAPGPDGSTRVVHHAIPARSFLRVPLMTRLQSRVDEIGRGLWRAIILKRGLMAALATLGTVATNLVDAAFGSGGFGQWAPNTAATIRRKGSSAPLIDSAQLRKSVTYQVVRGVRG